MRIETPRVVIRDFEGDDAENLRSGNTWSWQ